MVRHLAGQRLTVVEGAVEGLRLFLWVDVMCVDTHGRWGGVMLRMEVWPFRANASTMADS